MPKKFDWFEIIIAVDVRWRIQYFSDLAKLITLQKFFKSLLISVICSWINL